MKNKILDFCMKIVQENKKLTKKEIDTIRYGLEGLYLTITKIIIILIISIILGIFKEVLLLIVIFNGIRLTSFGVHAKRSIDCLISSILFFIFIPIICINITISFKIKLFIFIPIIILIGILSPSDTEKRPLNDKRKRTLYKILSIIISIVYMFLSLTVKDNTLSNSFMFALIIQIIIMLPITYKIFGVKYNNYKRG